MGFQLGQGYQKVNQQVTYNRRNKYSLAKTGADRKFIVGRQKKKDYRMSLPRKTNGGALRQQLPFSVAYSSIRFDFKINDILYTRREYMMLRY